MKEVSGKIVYRESYDRSFAEIRGTVDLFVMHKVAFATQESIPNPISEEMISEIETQMDGS